MKIFQSITKKIFVEARNMYILLFSIILLKYVKFHDQLIKDDCTFLRFK